MLNPLHGEMNPGRHAVLFIAEYLSGGVYFYWLKMGGIFDDEKDGFDEIDFLLYLLSV